MSQVELNTPAPEFTLDDYTGTPVTLSNYKGKKHVILALNRGFV
ncbi:MAG: redoxin domain-containing protein [Anaerolineales bacterium]|nr:redoxin domain-containing protein [Anaerolineales bacterium]